MEISSRGNIKNDKKPKRHRREARKEKQNPKKGQKKPKTNQKKHRKWGKRTPKQIFLKTQHLQRKL